MNHIVADRGLPELATIDGDGCGDETVGVWEGDVDSLAVAGERGGGGGRPLVFPHASGGMHLLLPEQTARRAVEGEHRLTAVALVAGGEIDRVAGDTGGAVAAAWDGRLPDQVVVV